MRIEKRIREGGLKCRCWSSSSSSLVDKLREGSCRWRRSFNQMGSSQNHSNFPHLFQAVLVERLLFPRN